MERPSRFTKLSVLIVFSLFYLISTTSCDAPKKEPTSIASSTLQEASFARVVVNNLVATKLRRQQMNKRSLQADEGLVDRLADKKKDGIFSQLEEYLESATTLAAQNAKPLRRHKRAPLARKPPRIQLAQRPKTTTTTTTTSTTTASTTTAESPTSESESELEEEETADSSEEETKKADRKPKKIGIEKEEEEESGEEEEEETETEKAPITSTSAPSSKSGAKLSKSSVTQKEQIKTKEARPAKEKTSFKKGVSSSMDSNKTSISDKEEKKDQMDEISALIKSKKKTPLVRLPFIKPKNDTFCTKEAYLEFPSDVFGNKWRGRGLVVIHIGVVCYMFYSLALVCERYFMPSLEEFAQRLGLSEDVAGATLMSAGSSAPELFTAILGVFIAKGDVGTGAIVGSAVFNILFVIGICAFVSTTTAQLDWWPVLRDSVFYTFTVLVLILFIYDERITAMESFTMIALYGLYILIMAHNDTVKEQVTRQLQMYPLTAKLINSAVSVEGPDDVFGSCSSGSIPPTAATASRQKGFFGSSGQQQKDYQTTSMTRQHQFGNKTVEEDSMFLAACLVIVQHKRLFRSQLRFQSAARYIIVKRQHRLQQQKGASINIKSSNEVNYFGPESDALQSPGDTRTAGSSHKGRIDAYMKSASLSKAKFSIVSKDDYEFWNRPPEEGENYYLWLAKIPVNYVLHYTCPDCSLYPDKYLFTFFISIAWTAFFSYIMVWMVTLIGYTFGIPDSVMGFTFLAAGTSIPDCYSSIHAAKNGMANMAVSNSIGSNVFDILIGLSLPWFIQTAIYPRVEATINSRGVIYSVILLFLSLIVTIYLMNQYEWTLKPRLGLALLIAYGLFIVLTCMLEFNLFGHVNPPPCPII